MRKCSFVVPGLCTPPERLCCDAGTRGLCPGFYNDRSVFGFISPGKILSAQRRPVSGIADISFPTFLYVVQGVSHMRTTALLLSSLICGLLIFGTFSDASAAEREGRAVWTHSGLGAYPGDWNRSAKLLADNGFNMIIACMAWGGVANYNSDLLPRSELCKKYGDQIEQCCAAARKHGLDIHIWKVHFQLRADTPKDFMEKLRREGRLQVDVEGKQRDWLCPTHPENRKLELDCMLEIARKYSIDGLHSDYIRYPDRETCYCEGCRRRFEADSGRKVSDWPAECYSGARKEEYNDWRCRQIDMLVEAISREVRKIKPDLKLSAAVFRKYPLFRIYKAQDWPVWVKAGQIDFVCPMNYTNSNEDFTEMVRDQVRIIDGRIPLYSGIGVKSSKSELTAEQVLEQIRISRSLGADGFVLFSFNDKTAETIIPAIGKTLKPKRVPAPHSAQ